MKGFGVIKTGQVGWIEKDVPHMGPLDALVKPLAVSPCTSDIHAVQGGGSSEKSNRILGHEAIGEVVKVGDLVKNFRPGDKVVVSTLTPDWLAKNVQGQYEQHDHGMMKSFKYVSQKDGVFAELFHVNQADANLAILPDDVKPEAALMIVDMMSTGFHAAELANIGIGDTVAVFGIGPVGLMALAGARLRGAARIIAIGTRAKSIEVAKAYGASEIVSYKEGDIVEQIKLLTGGEGVDSALIAGGVAETLSQAVAAVKPGGTVANVNFFDIKDTLCVPAYLWGLGMSNKDIRGGFCPGGALRLEKLLQVVRYGLVDPLKLVTHRFNGFDKIEDAYRLMEKKPSDLIKPVVFI